MLQALLLDEKPTSVDWTPLGEDVVRRIEALSARSSAAQTPSRYEPAKNLQAPWKISHPNYMRYAHKPFGILAVLVCS